MTVFDSSALLAYLRGEAGADDVKRHLESGGSCSAANWSEVAQKVASSGAPWSDSRTLLLRFGLRIHPVSVADAEAAAALWVRGAGLSLGDRLCLALGARLDETIVTCDRAWEGLPRVELVR